MVAKPEELGPSYPVQLRNIQFTTYYLDLSPSTQLQLPFGFIIVIGFLYSSFSPGFILKGISGQTSGGHTSGAVIFYILGSGFSNFRWTYLFIDLHYRWLGIIIFFHLLDLRLGIIIFYHLPYHRLGISFSISSAFSLSRSQGLLYTQLHNDKFPTPPTTTT